MKKHHYPNRSTRQIQEDINLIQAMRPYSYSNRRRNSHRFHIYAIAACTVAAIAIILYARA